MGDVGRVIGGRYRVDRELGGEPGTQSLLVTDQRNGRPCVLRQLPVAAASAAAVRRFEAQAAILAKLDHPGLPRLLDEFSEGEGDAAVRAVVTGYHPGENLERLVAKGRPLGEPQALLFLRRLVKILMYLHSFEPPLVHRGIKATGIIIGPDGRPCLTDLNYAAAEPAVPSAQHAPPGPDELALAAPEVYMDGAVPASDIYALGLAVCRGMTAKDLGAVLREGARLQLRASLGVSEGFAVVLARMLEPSLERRYPDARALDADLARLSGGWGAPAHQQPERTAEAPRPARKIRPLLLAGIALALAVSAAAVVFLQRRQPAPEPSLVVSPAPQPQTDAPPPLVQEPPAPSATAVLPAQPPVAAVPDAEAPGPEPAPAAVPEPSPAVEPPAVAVPAAQPAVEPAPVAGAEARLLFDGKPFASAAAPAPVFWFRDEGTKKEVKPRVDASAGVFSIHGLQPGSYAMSVRVNLEPGNPNIFPGDLSAWEEFTVEAGRTASVPVSLRTVMHLLQPIDNGAVVQGWDVPCGAGNPSPGKLVFSWGPLGPGTRYDVSVYRLQCGRGYAPAGRVFANSTTESWTRVDLPPNQEGECYSFRLSANREGRTVGIMTTHGKSGVGWDYRFTVPQ